MLMATQLNNIITTLTTRTYKNGPNKRYNNVILLNNMTKKKCIKYTPKEQLDRIINFSFIASIKLQAKNLFFKNKKSAIDCTNTLVVR